MKEKMVYKAIFCNYFPCPLIKEATVLSVWIWWIPDRHKLISIAVEEAW